MKRGFTMVLAAVLLLCFTGCAGDKPPESPDNGLLSAEKLLGTYDISYQSGTENGSRTVELRLLNERLPFTFYPDRELNGESSFDSYGPGTGRAQLQRTQQDERGKLIVSCDILFTEADGKASVSGNGTITQGDATEESCILSGEMIEKL